MHQKSYLFVCLLVLCCVCVFLLLWMFECVIKRRRLTGVLLSLPTMEDQGRHDQIRKLVRTCLSAWPLNAAHRAAKTTVNNSLESREHWLSINNLDLKSLTAHYLAFYTATCQLKKWTWNIDLRFLYYVRIMRMQSDLRDVKLCEELVYSLTVKYLTLECCDWLIRSKYSHCYRQKSYI